MTIAAVVAATLALSLARAQEPVQPKPEGLRVIKSALCLRVFERRPAEELSGSPALVPAGAERVYYWLKVAASKTPDAVKVVWTADSIEVAQVELPVKHASMRTWASKRVWPGAWKVEALDAAGKVLASAEFTVSAASGPQD